MLQRVNPLLHKDRLLAEMVGQWQANQTGNYRASQEAEPAANGLRKMLFGMGSLSLGELDPEVAALVTPVREQVKINDVGCNFAASGFFPDSLLIRKSETLLVGVNAEPVPVSCERD